MSEHFLGNSIPIAHHGEYSPVQVRGGLVEPTPDDFPPAHERVPQQDLPLKHDLAEYNPLRVTMQTSDICQLACPGCYVKEWTDPAGSIRQQHDRIDTPDAEVSDHIRALGPELQDVYFLGVEPTLRPNTLHEVAKTAKEIGSTVMSITNGASPIRQYEETFRELLDTGEVYKILLSLDSIDPAINNRLRGKSFAYERTMDTIRHAVANNDPIKVNVTAWPDNYHTVVETAETLFSMGVRGFGFHCGSVEGIPEPDAAQLMHLDPLAWRALCTELLDFRDRHYDELDNFTMPYIFFTEKELAEGIIGDESAYQAYKEHQAKTDVGIIEPNPVKVCPSLGVPQVYVFGNDGKNGNGAVSLCNIHTIGANKRHGHAYFADYNSDTKRFEVEPDPAHNELAIMQESPFLCPAREYAMNDDNPGDKSSTEAGNVYHACRYVSANQFPYAQKDFAREYYRPFRDFYALWSRAVGSQAVAFHALKAIHASDDPITTKLANLQELMT